MSDKFTDQANAIMRKQFGDMWVHYSSVAVAFADALRSAVGAERERCLAALGQYAAYEGEEDPFDLVAAVMRQSPKYEVPK